MKILFPEEYGRSLYDGGDSWKSVSYWSDVLTEMHRESGANNDADFDEWLLDNWQIKLLYSDDIIYNVSGIEIADESISLLLMRYPSNI